MTIQPMRYRLRWRYDFKDGTVKRGMWSNAGGRQEDKAWFNNKPGVIRASIEGEDLRTFEVKTLAQCDGWDFVNFQWLAAAFVGNIFTSANSIKPVSRLLGMKILTRTKIIEVLDTGKVNVSQRSPDHMNTKFATFGK